MDGALRAKAGPDLIDACLALPVLDTEGKRDLVRWTRAVKVGESSVVRCPTGSAVKTTAGSLEADAIIHAVAPDVELTYGRYKSSEGPEDLLRSAYRSSFKAASDLECVACPALGRRRQGLGSGRDGGLWPLEAAARAVLDGTAPRRVDFVVDDAAFAAWSRVAETLLGPGADDAWTIDPEELVEDDAGDLLPLRDVDEICLPRTLWATERAGTRKEGRGGGSQGTRGRCDRVARRWRMRHCPSPPPSPQRSRWRRGSPRQAAAPSPRRVCCLTRAPRDAG